MLAYFSFSFFVKKAGSLRVNGRFTIGRCACVRVRARTRARAPIKADNDQSHGSRTLSEQLGPASFRINRELNGRAFQDPHNLARVC